MLDVKEPDVVATQDVVATHLQPKMEDEDKRMTTRKLKSLPPWAMQDDTNKGHTHTVIKNRTGNI